jgi:hypothetical protein
MRPRPARARDLVIVDRYRAVAEVLSAMRTEPEWDLVVLAEVSRLG